MQTPEIKRIREKIIDRKWANQLHYDNLRANLISQFRNLSFQLAIIVAGFIFIFPELLSIVKDYKIFYLGSALLFFDFIITLFFVVYFMVSDLKNSTKNFNDINNLYSKVIKDLEKGIITQIEEREEKIKNDLLEQIIPFISVFILTLSFVLIIKSLFN